MKREISCEIKCENPKCNKWFPSGIVFGDFETLDSSTLIGNLQNCPHCGKMTGCNKENMHFVERKEDGRVTIIEGKDAW